MINNLKKVCLIGLVLSSFSALANPVPPLYSVCTTCHGVDGVPVAENYPIIAGQNKAYLISTLKAYKNGERTNVEANMMVPMAQMLTTDKMIEEMATYISGLERP